MRSYSTTLLCIEYPDHVQGEIPVKLGKETEEEKGTKREE